MTLSEFYIQNGGDVKAVLKRIPSEEMIKKFVLKFRGDPSYSQLKDALAAGDLKAEFFAAHTLKGVAQNLGFTELFQAVSELTEKLRGATEEPPQEMVDRVDAHYRRLIETIDALE